MKFDQNNCCVYKKTMNHFYTDQLYPKTFGQVLYVQMRMYKNIDLQIFN